MSAPLGSARPWRLAHVTAMFALVALAASACSVENSLAPPLCSEGAIVIEAQSVPTAQLIPCFGDLPAGWSFASVAINQSGTMIDLDSDRAGDDAATFRFDASCDVAGAVALPSSFRDVEHFESIERLQPSFRATSYLLFDGGCVTWVFAFDKDASATESVALEEALVFITRKELNDDLRENFVDEEL